MSHSSMKPFSLLLIQKVLPRGMEKTQENKSESHWLKFNFFFTLNKPQKTKTS